jgi:FMN phosphatase YigB (HAD superfamily)
MRAVFDSLGSSTEDGDGQPLRIEPLLISEELDAEKPSSKIFEEAYRLAGVGAQETLHVGDELEAYVLFVTSGLTLSHSFEYSDYWGARKAGLQALLLRRAGPEGMEGPRELGEDLDGVSVVESLQDVLHRIGSV